MSKASAHNRSEKPSWKRSGLQAATVALYMTVAMAIYFAIANDGNPAPLSTKSAIDAFIPRLPLFVWVYISPYLISPFLVVGTRRDVFLGLVKRGTVVVALQLIFFYLVPTVVERPPLIVTDAASISERMLRFVYTLDSPPRNAAPSGHVSLAIVLCWAASKSVGKAGPLVWLYCSVVSLSIVFTKQHHFIDLVTGVALGALVLGSFAAIDRRRHRGAESGGAAAGPLP